jgi:hypothetical protein
MRTYLEIFDDFSCFILIQLSHWHNHIAISTSFRIGTDGKLKLEEKLKGVYLMGKEVQKNLSEAKQEVSKTQKQYIINTIPSTRL